MTTTEKMDLAGITDWVKQYHIKHGITRRRSRLNLFQGEAFGEFLLLLNGLVHAQDGIGPWLELTDEGSQDIIDSIDCY